MTESDLREAIRAFDQWLREQADEPLSDEDRHALHALYVELRKLVDGQ